MTLHELELRDTLARYPRVPTREALAQRCVYCGDPSPAEITCDRHADLPALDPPTNRASQTTRERET